MLGQRRNASPARYHHPAFRFVGENSNKGGERDILLRRHAYTTLHFGLLEKTPTKAGNEMRG